MEMRASTALKGYILDSILVEATNRKHLEIKLGKLPSSVDPKDIDRVWKLVDSHEDGSCWLWETKDEIRAGEVETGLQCGTSRYFLSKAVGMLLPQGWVGWTYWYGGGKHSEPEVIDWISDAYWLECSEEEKVVVVRTFTKR